MFSWWYVDYVAKMPNRIVFLGNPDLSRLPFSTQLSAQCLQQCYHDLLAKARQDDVYVEERAVRRVVAAGQHHLSLNRIQPIFTWSWMMIGKYIGKTYQFFLSCLKCWHQWSLMDGIAMYCSVFFEGQQLLFIAIIAEPGSAETWWTHSCFWSSIEACFEYDTDMAYLCIYIYIYLPMLYVQRYMQINIIYIYTYTQFHWSKDPWIFVAPLDSPFPSPSSHSRPQDLSVLPNFASEGHGQVDTDISQMNTYPLVN